MGVALPGCASPNESESGIVRSWKQFPVRCYQHLSRNLRSFLFLQLIYCFGKTVLASLGAEE